MGDRTSVQMKIGGQLKRSLVQEFIDAATADGMGLEWGNGPDLEEEHFPAGACLVLTGNEINYANCDELEAFCRKHGLQYRKTWDAGGGYPAGGELVDAEGSTEFPVASTDGEASLWAHEIKAARSLAELVARAELITREPPALEVVDG